jgi:hypothetical protein
MKLKSFDDLVKKRFTKEEIAEIKQKAKLEVQILRSLQKAIDGRDNRHQD